MKKLMVCGCSFSAPSQTAPGTSWSEKLATKLGWDLQNLARQGCSNGGVRIQIDEVIRQRPDFAIVTPTFWDRIELPVSAAPTTATGVNLQEHLQNQSLHNGYDAAAGIDNVNYGNNQYRMICETIFSLADNIGHIYRRGSITKEAQTAVKHYLNYMYDTNWKHQLDKWLMIEGALELVHSGIPFLFVPQLLWINFEHIDSKASLIGEKYLLRDDSMSQAAVTTAYPFTGEDPGYHGSEQSQEVIAENFRNIMKERWDI